MSNGRPPLAVLAALALSGCGGAGGGLDAAPGNSLSTPPAPTDIEIATMLYAGTPRTPSGFLEDPAPTSFEQITTYHVKSTQIDPNASQVYELCTDDWNEALAWSETLAQQGPSYLDLVGNTTTLRYFEFDRVPRGAPERYVRMRVYRCAYLDRTDVDLAAGDDKAGLLNYRPLDAAAVGGLSEYVWRFTTYNNAGHVVLSSEPVAAPGGLAHRLTMASLRRAADTQSCDTVDVHAWTHVALADGTLRASASPLRRFSVRRVGDGVTIC